MSKFKGPMTAKELMDQLSKDPEYLRRRAEKDARRRERTRRLDAIRQPILQRLAEAGFPIDDIYGLVKTYGLLPKSVVDILIASLEECENDTIRDSLVRELAGAAEPFDGRPLAKCFDSTNSYNLQFAIVNTITLAHPHSIDDWLANLLKNDHWRDLYLALSQTTKRKPVPREIEGGIVVRQGDEMAPVVPPPGLSEASMDFDDELVRPFLERVSTLVSSFGATEIEKLLRVVEELDVDEEAEIRFDVMHHEQDAPLHIRIFRDDVDVVALFFFAPAVLAEEIDQLMQDFIDEHEL